MDTQELRELSELCLEVAREAGELVHAAFRSRPATDVKTGFADLVTEYDLASEQLIRRRLESTGIPIVGEEQGGPDPAAGPLNSGLSLHIDSIDGTTNFVHGHPFYCVSIGLLGPRGPLMGVVVAPALRQHWVGGPELGATRDGVPCTVTSTASLSDCLLATGFAPDQRGPARQANIGNYTRLLARVRGIRRCGSAALDLVMTADGTYDGYWEMALHSWDIVGGVAIALGAGGMVTNLAGGPVDWDAGYLCVSGGPVHDQLLSQFEDAQQDPSR